MKRYFFYLTFLFALLHLLNVNYFAQNEEDSVLAEIGSLFNLELAEEKYICFASKSDQILNEIPSFYTFKTRGDQS